MKAVVRYFAVSVLIVSCVALSGCRNSGSPYEEFEILPLEEAPAVPEAPDADASIAAEDRDAEVEEQEEKSRQRDASDAPVYYAQARLHSKTIQAGGTLVADIRLVSMDNNGDAANSSFHTYLDGQELESEGGKVHFEKVCATPGSYYLQGVIYVETPTGTEKYPYSENYTVE